MLRLVRLNRENYPLLVDMMDEWTGTGEKLIPYSIRREDYHNFEKYAASLDLPLGNGTPVENSTYFCLDDERNIFVGAVNIRHFLNERFLLKGGHIGDGVRPIERGKGTATKMIALALEKCRELGIDRALFVCEKDNVASAKSIRNNGGILENEIIDEEEGGVVLQRYWIEIEQ